VHFRLCGQTASQAYGEQLQRAVLNMEYSRNYSYPRMHPLTTFEKRATSTYLTYRKTLTNRAKNLRTLPTGPWNPGTIFEPLSRVDACTSFAGSAP